jgi:hypothetical protein
MPGRSLERENAMYCPSGDQAAGQSSGPSFLVPVNVNVCRRCEVQTLRPACSRSQTIFQGLTPVAAASRLGTAAVRTTPASPTGSRRLSGPEANKGNMWPVGWDSSVARSATPPPLGVRGFEMPVRFAPRLLSDSRAHARISGRAGLRNRRPDGSGLGSVSARPVVGPGRIGGCSFPSLISFSPRS